MRFRSIYLSLRWFVIASILVSCASAPQNVSRDTNSRTQKEATSAEPDQSFIPFQKETSTPTATDIEHLTIDDVIRLEEPNTQNLYDNSRYDFPITINSRVEGWIDYFTGIGRGHMERYLSRSSRYIPVMKQTFKKSGLPEDLVYLALIESGFNLRAKSRAKAVGPWQFMKATGKRYGLRVDAWVDERKDPIRSTEAAANYLKDLYLMFESWYLAASAYNAGEYKVLRAIEESKTNNYWRICETRMLRRETKDYVPKLIAAAIIAKNPEKYGFSDVEYQEPLQFDSISVSAPLKLKSVAKLLHVPEDDILDLNPAFARSITPPHGGPYELRIPPGTKLLLERTLASNKTDLEADDIPTQITVKRGDNLKSIAQKYRINVKTLANLNNLSTKDSLSPGTNLLLPKGAAFQSAQKSTSQPPTSRTPSSAVTSTGDFLTHTVTRGESLWSISEQYNVTVQNIFRWNGLKKSQIVPGKKIKIKVTRSQESKKIHKQPTTKQS
ncbi:MAG: LysM peptidoglycan-binding domain-containing protein [Deltaproteobacteria bacterium]|nr:LysM peptidoglycan-binding domain-containing protein [Deltaproteobacteria bacterium]